MGTTTGGLPYPEPSSLLQETDLAIKALAEAVLLVPSPAPTPTMATGWTLTSATFRKIGTSLAWVELALARAAGAATITASTGGGGVVDNEVLTLPAGWRPVRRQFLAADRGTETFWRCSVVANTGVMSLVSGVNGGTITAGDSLFVADMLALS